RSGRLTKTFRSAVRVSLVGTRGMLRRQRQRQRREDVLTGRRQVVVDLIAVRERRHIAGLRQRAYADDVRQRGGVVGPVPRRCRRGVRVAEAATTTTPWRTAYST